jgi:hypothetical protein
VLRTSGGFFVSVQTVQTSVEIEWDDSVVIIFSFAGADGKIYCGFPHIVPAWQNQTGTQTQISATVQRIQQTSMQISGDPATWVETVKQGARNGKITIVYDDSSSTSYTTYTSAAATPYQLQNLYSLAG